MMMMIHLSFSFRPSSRHECLTTTLPIYNAQRLSHGHVQRARNNRHEPPQKTAYSSASDPHPQTVHDECIFVLRHFLPSTVPSSPITPGGKIIERDSIRYIAWNSVPVSSTSPPVMPVSQGPLFQDSDLELRSTPRIR
jgi:hypothetical protein